MPTLPEPAFQTGGECLAKPNCEPIVMPSQPNPKTYLGVMVSSTFTDLQEHRAALIRIIDGASLKPVVMENDSAKPDGDVIDSSLKMVRDASAVVGVISQKYGQTPACPKRNPDGLSISELEFNEAQRLGRHILLFIMGEDHPGKKSVFEFDPVKLAKLDAFRERAKKARSDSEVHRVYAVFSSPEEFEKKAAQSIAELRLFLETQGNGAIEDAAAQPVATSADPLPRPPAFYAEPPYIGSHEFLGRRAELVTLDEWAQPADAHPVLLFEAIGGSGKSMLTWEWANRQSASPGWSGIFWYSFYERGAVMADFCAHALAYMSGQPLAELRGKKTLELADDLLRRLRSQRWLLILDGLERVLVAYNRVDAAQLRDEEAGQSDAIANRDPCAAIRPEDDELLRSLAAAAPSKLLITSRLIPRVLLNAAGQPIPGVLQQRLGGLRSEDAEALFRACGIGGESAALRDYLKRHCDCHPLAVGVLAGLIGHYLPARGDFDAWLTAQDGGGRFDFADLDLTQKRNHILAASLADLPPDSRRLLGMIALLSEAVDYPTLQALNPFLPEPIPQPEEVDRRERRWLWRLFGLVRKARAKRKYEKAAVKRLQSAEYRAAGQRLDQPIIDLVNRGLLQYDQRQKHYDLHPVVRSVTAERLAAQDAQDLGLRVVDHFSSRQHDPYERAETLGDVRDGLYVVRTLQRMGKFQQALYAYYGDLGHALTFNLEAHAETLTLLRPFFPDGWDSLPVQVDARDATWLANDAAIALGYLGQREAQMGAFARALTLDLESKIWRNVVVRLGNISVCWMKFNRLAKTDVCLHHVLNLAICLNDRALFRVRLDSFKLASRLGRWAEADELWRLLDPMGRDWERYIYRPGHAESSFAWDRFHRGILSEAHLAQAERLASEGRSRREIRDLHRLRGHWRLECGEWASAAASYQDALAMARSAGLHDEEAETGLALTQFHLGQLSDPRQVVKDLATLPQPDHLTLASLWQAIGDVEQARQHALSAYRWAWADGEPFVHRYELDKARALLESLGEPTPDLPPYDPSRETREPWEDAVQAGIEELKAAKNRK